MTEVWQKAFYLTFVPHQSGFCQLLRGNIPQPYFGILGKGNAFVNRLWLVFDRPLKNHRLLVKPSLPLGITLIIWWHNHLLNRQYLLAVVVVAHIHADNITVPMPLNGRHDCFAPFGSDAVGCAISQPHNTGRNVTSLLIFARFLKFYQSTKIKLPKLFMLSSPPVPCPAHPHRHCRRRWYLTVPPPPFA